jgi:hypothetical protein
MVGAAGLEPATLCLEGRCSIHLSYAPTEKIYHIEKALCWRAHRQGFASRAALDTGPRSLQYLQSAWAVILPYTAPGYRIMAQMAHLR